MKPKHALVLAVALYGLFAVVEDVSAQGTAFTYQGRLNSSGSPANGNYDFTFSLFNNSGTNSGHIGSTLTNLDLGVTNGLFTVTLNFGAVFTGNATWLAISVRTNGGESFTALNPLQELMPTPYAIYAPNAGAALTANSATSAISAAEAGVASLAYQVSGANVVGPILNSSLPANPVFSGTVTANAFSGNGGGLTNIIPQSYVNVLNAGVTNDGVTDVTVSLQNLLNKGGAFYFPPGRYYAQELTLHNNTTLLGSGAVLVYATNSWNNNIFVRGLLNSNITILGLGFDGGDYSDITTRTWYGYNNSGFATNSMNIAAGTIFGYWNPMGLRHGLQFNVQGGGSIFGITIFGFSGIGLLPVAPEQAINYLSWSVKTYVSGVTCYSNFMGLFSSGTIGESLVIGTNAYQPNWITNYVSGAADPEWMSYSGLNLVGNTIGLCASAGNCTYVNSIIDGNLFGEFDCGGYNSTHGCMNSIIFTHNIDAALYMHGYPIGEQIINCQFRDNGSQTIILDDSQGITIDFCTFAPLSITVENTYGNGQNFFRNNSYSGTWAGQTFSTDGHLIYYGNYSYDTAGDNDGQPLTLLESGNTSGLTFTNAAGAQFQLQVNTSTNGFNFLSP